MAQKQLVEITKQYLYTAEMEEIIQSHINNHSILDNFTTDDVRELLLMNNFICWLFAREYQQEILNFPTKKMPL